MANKIKLVALVLNDFGRHEDLLVEFSDTLTVIKGPNGTGKSTIMHGILVAAFGVSAVEGNADDLPRTGGKGWRSVLTLQADDSTVELSRTSSTATFRRDGELKATGHTAVNAEVEALFGMPKKTFMDLVYSEQTQTATMMGLGATALNKIIERIAEADFITLVETKASSIAGLAENSLSVIDKPKDLSQLQEALLQATTDANESKLIFEAAESDAKAAKEKVDEYQPVLSDAIKKTNRLKELRTLRESALMQVERNKALAESAASELTQKTVTQELVDKSAADRDAARADVQKTRESIERAKRYDREIARLNDWFDTIGNKQVALYNELRPQVDAAELAYAAARDARVEQSSAYNQAVASLQKANESLAESACPTCKRAYDDELRGQAEAGKAAAEQTVKDLSAKRTEAMQAESDAKAKMEALQKACPSTNIVDHAEQNKIALEDLHRDKPQNAPDEDALAALERQYQELVERASQARRDLADRQALETKFETANAAVKASNEKLETADKEIADIGEVNLVAVNEEMDNRKTEANGAATVALSAKTKMQSDRTMVEAVQLDIRKTEELIRQREAFEKRAASFSGLSKYLRTNRTTFMAELWDSLMQQTSEFVAMVTEGRIERIERNDDGRFYYVEHGERRAYARLAGGLKAVAGVGLRLALASLLPSGVSLVLLDEPSAELADDTAAALAGALRATDRQVVLITHRQGEEYVSDKVVELSL